MKRIRVFVWVLTTVLIGLAVSAGPRPVYADDGGGPVCRDTGSEITCETGFRGCTQNGAVATAKARAAWLSSQWDDLADRRAVLPLAA